MAVNIIYDIIYDGEDSEWMLPLLKVKDAQSGRKLLGNLAT